MALTPISNSLAYTKAVSQYTKQLRIGNLYPLYNPKPLSESDNDEINIGDVGKMTLGGFSRLFSVVTADHGKYNNTRRGVPKDLQPLTFNPDTDLVKTTFAKPGDGEVWCGSSKLTWKRVTPPGSSDRHLYYEFEKKDNSVVYVLVSPRVAIETSVRDEKLDEWRTHMEQNFKQWANFTEQKLKPTKADDLVFVVGFVKTSQWVRLALKDSGIYTLEVDPESYVNASLKLGGEPVQEEQAAIVIHGDNSETYFDGLQRSMKENGIQPSVSEFQRRHCLFVQGWKMEKGILGKKMAAASKPQDLPRDGPSEGSHPVAITNDLDDVDLRANGEGYNGRRPYHTPVPQQDLGGFSTVQKAACGLSAYRRLPHRSTAMPRTIVL